MAASPLDRLLKDIRKCRVCVEAPKGRPLPHEPRPVLRVSATARLAIVGQAPGTRVHASGIPFTDPSGDRLRSWMGVTSEEFYDASRVAVIPMGFCFPGLSPAGADLPPRTECAPLWRKRVFALLPQIELLLLVGLYAQRWHMTANGSLTETVALWRDVAASSTTPRIFPLPHPSWRNNGWLRKNPWFETDLVPELQRSVRTCIDRKTI